MSKLIEKYKNIVFKLKLFLISNPLAIADLWRRRGLEIGEDTYIYKNVVFGRGGHDPISIGKNCILTGCTILGHDASTDKGLGIKYGELSIRMPTIVNDDCFIGYGSIVLMGVNIGKGSIIGAGAVVSKDVPENSVVAGNPGKVICSTSELINKRRILYESHPEYFPTKPRKI